MSLKYYTDDEDDVVVSEYRSMRDVLTHRTPPDDASSPTDDRSGVSSPTDTTPSILDTDGPRGEYTERQLLRSVVYLSVGAACLAVSGCALYATLTLCL